MSALQPCGTPAAYVRHIRKGTPICPPCYAAHAASERERNAARTRQRQQEHDIRQVIHILATAMGAGRNTA